MVPKVPASFECFTTLLTGMLVLVLPFNVQSKNMSITKFLVAVFTSEGASSMHGFLMFRQIFLFRETGATPALPWLLFEMCPPVSFQCPRLCVPLVADVTLDMGTLGLMHPALVSHHALGGGEGDVAHWAFISSSFCTPPIIH